MAELVTMVALKPGYVPPRQPGPVKGHQLITTVRTEISSETRFHVIMALQKYYTAEMVLSTMR